MTSQDAYEIAKKWYGKGFAPSSVIELSDRFVFALGENAAKRHLDPISVLKRDEKIEAFIPGVAPESSLKEYQTKIPEWD